MCLLTYRTSDVDVLQRAAEREGAALPSLPSRTVEILATIAYARRHVDVMRRLVTFPSPAKSIFDRITRSILAERRGRSSTFQHSKDSARNQVLEWKMWSALLRSDWVHHMSRKPESLYWGLLELLSFQQNPAARSSPSVEEFLRSLGHAGFDLPVSTIAHYLSINGTDSPAFPHGVIPVAAPKAKTILSCFPADKIVKKGDSLRLALPITQWPLKKPDRLVVMRVLLEQGIDPNDKPDYVDPWGARRIRLILLR